MVPMSRADRGRVLVGRFRRGLLDQDDVMLVLSRKVGEKILIGDDIAITVVRVAQGTVRIGVEAPQSLQIVREEIKGQRKKGEAPHPNLARPG